MSLNKVTYSYANIKKKVLKWKLYYSCGNMQLQEVDVENT
jgi:hypothetical protein